MKARTAHSHSMLPKHVADEIRAFCEAHADPERVKKYSRYFVEGYDCYGVNHKLPEWEACRNQCLARLKQAGPACLLDACDLLVRPGKYEEVFTAILFVSGTREMYSPEFFSRLANWFEQGIANWAETDVLAGQVIGHFLSKGIVGLAELQPWAIAPHKYQRRAVPVSMIPVLKETQNFRPFFRLIEPLMSDGEKVVQQGVGWFLREAWKQRPEITEAFLLRFKDTCPRLIVQYATEKMDTASKQRFKRAR